MSCEGCKNAENNCNSTCRECLNGDLKIVKELDYSFNHDVSETSAMFYSDEEALQDRKNFVRNLGILASQTRDQVISMELEVITDTDEEYVIITYKGGSQKQINVRLDSYSAIVRDVFKHL